MQARCLRPTCAGAKRKHVRSSQPLGVRRTSDPDLNSISTRHELDTTLELGTIIDIATGIAIILGIAFAIVELRQSNRDRRDQAAFDVVRTVQTQEVRIAVQQVLSLPNDADPKTIRNDPAVLDAALAVDSACEMWGSMVYEGVVDQHMLDRMVGGWVRGSWSRLGRWVEAEREDTGNPNIGEWWQWLYERLESNPDPGKARGAHVSYRGKERR